MKSLIFLGLCLLQTPAITFANDAVRARQLFARRDHPRAVDLFLRRLNSNIAVVQDLIGKSESPEELSSLEDRLGRLKTARDQLAMMSLMNCYRLLAIDRMDVSSLNLRDGDVDEID